ncbi:hypothetical protein GCM10011509_04200 [Ornithinimicrobium pekingense]|uniref:Uncharacterized protein n=1 Tax=Ornithinimicrobium pekingense TaxID=384677 RepID=A0ABQ2F3Z6_9MICO|nr:hypothetical protein GCM10011509_04200 [Ornithinimicrobium pekingense]
MAGRRVTLRGTGAEGWKVMTWCQGACCAPPDGSRGGAAGVCGAPAGGGECGGSMAARLSRTRAN